MAHGDDLVSELIAHIPRGGAIRQVGALDDLEPRQIDALAGQIADEMLITRLRNGSCVSLPRGRVTPLLQRGLDRLRYAGVKTAVLLCTEAFPELRFDGVLIRPHALLTQVVRALAPRRLGVMVPLASQTAAADEQWQAVAREVVVVGASPYKTDEPLEEAVRALQGRALDLVVLDCLGYTPGHKRLTSAHVGCATLLPVSLVGRLLAELLA